MNNKLFLNPYDPELLESLKIPGGRGAKCPPPSELSNYNPNAKTDVTLFSQHQKSDLIQLDEIKPSWYS